MYNVNNNSIQLKLIQCLVKLPLIYNFNIFYFICLFPISTVFGRENEAQIVRNVLCLDVRCQIEIKRWMLSGPNNCNTTTLLRNCSTE